MLRIGSTPPSGHFTSETIESDPTLVNHGGNIYLYAKAGGVLKRWTYVTATDTWSGPTVEKWSDGTDIVPEFGIAATWGYQTDMGGLQLYSIIPVPDSSMPGGKMEMARYDFAASNWVKFASTIWPSGLYEYTRSKPGLAYVPFDAVDPTKGRFYLAWARAVPPTPTGDPGTGDWVPFITMTEGNDPAAGATTRRLKWRSRIYANNSGLVTSEAVNLMYDRDYDANLRLTHTAQGGSASFWPFADGIFNIGLQDQDDYYYINNNLDCAILAVPCL